MNAYKNKKEFFGKILIALSILMLFYLVSSPLTHFFIHIDEFYTVTFINFPFLDLLNITANDVHPPLYYMMAKSILKFLSFLGISYDTLFVLKIFSIIPYLIIIIFSLTKIKKDYGWFTAGVFSFSMIVMSDFFYNYLVARMYSWAALFLLIAFIYFKDVITTFDKKSLILFTLFSVACAYTQYISAISIGVIYLMFLIYLVLYHKDKIKYWVMSVAVSVIMYLPWIPVLFNQLTGSKVATFEIPEVTLELALSAFSYFVDSYFVHPDLIVNFMILLILVAFILIYYSESINLDDIDCFYMVSGFSVYILTIIIMISISIYKPILLNRYLLPATAVFWLAISILVNKINNKRTFLVAIVLLLLLFGSGIADVFDVSQTYYDKGMHHQDVLDTISEDNNSIVISTSPFKFLYFSDQWDMYCVCEDTLFGESPDRLHQVYDFKEIKSYDMDNFIKNNSNKNIYIAGMGEPDVSDDIITTSLLEFWGLDISKVFNYNTSVSIGYEGLSEVKIPEGFDVENISTHYLVLSNGNDTYVLNEHIDKSLDSIIEEYYASHKEDKVTLNSFNVGDVVVSGLELEKNGEYIHTNYYFEKNGVTYQIYPEDNSNMDILKEIVASVK